MTSGTARPLVWSLAAVTSLLLVASSVLLVLEWQGRAGVSPEAGPVLERHGVRVPLPAGSDVLPIEERLYYTGAGGEPVAQVRGPAVLAPGACAQVPGSSRGFVGLVRAAGATSAMHERLVAAWSDGLGRAVGSPARAVPLDAAAGLRTDLVAEVRVDEPCQPERVRASLLTVRAEGRPVTVVLVRDVGAPGELGDGMAELLLAEAGAQVGAV